MNIIIEIDKNKWVLYMEGQYKGVSIKNKIRNKKTINAFVDSLDTPQTVIVGHKDLEIKYDDCNIILKDYKNYQIANNKILSDVEIASFELKKYIEK